MPAKSSPRVEDVVAQRPEQGGQRILPGNEGPTLDADLGTQTGPITVRWSVGPQSPRPAVLQFREAWLWNLRPDAATLTAMV